MSFTLGVHQHRLAALQGCRVTGSVYMHSVGNQETECGTSASFRHNNTFIAPPAPVYWPAEDGPFVFVPDHLTAY